MQKSDLTSKEDILKQDIKVLKITAWVIGIFNRNEIFTIKDLIEYGFVRLLEIPEFEMKYYTYVKRKLEAFVNENDLIKDMYLEMIFARPLSKIPIQELDVPPKVINTLMNAGIDNFEKLDEATLMKMPGISATYKRRILAIRKQIEERTIDLGGTKNNIGLDSSVSVLNLQRNKYDILIINNITNIRELIRIGRYGLVHKGIRRKLAEEIWGQVENLARFSQEIHDALELRRAEVKEKQDKYKDMPISALKRFFITTDVRDYLENLLGISTIGEIIQISESDIDKLEADPNVIQKILATIKKINEYYENGTLEELTEEILEKNITLESPISSLNLTNKAIRALEKINCITIKQIITFGGIDGLILNGIERTLAEQIWEQVEKSSHIFGQIEDELKAKEDEIKEKQREYQSIFLTEIKFINANVFDCLTEQFRIETIGQLVNLTDAMILGFVQDINIANSIIQFIKRVKLYYNSGCLEILLNRITEKDATLDSPISVLKLTKAAERALTEICISDLHKIIEAGEYGLRRQGIKSKYAKEIWEQIEKLAKMSPAIKEAIDVQEQKKEVAKIRYDILPIEKLTILPLKHLIFLKQLGVKTVGKLVSLTEEQLVDDEVEFKKGMFRYIRNIKTLYDNADLERVLEKTMPRIESEWTYDIDIGLGEDTNVGKSVFSLHYSRLRQNVERLYEINGELLIKIFEASRLFNEIALRRNNRSDD